jgi:hypothetical protein
VRTILRYGDNLGKPDAINPHVRFDERGAGAVLISYHGSRSSTLLFSIQSRIGYGLEDGKKVYEEKIHVVQKFEIIALDFHNLVLRELKDSHEEIISFQRVIEE